MIDSNKSLLEKLKSLKQQVDILTYQAKQLKEENKKKSEFLKQLSGQIQNICGIKIKGYTEKELKNMGESCYGSTWDSLPDHWELLYGKFFYDSEELKKLKNFKARIRNKILSKIRNKISSSIC